jgi:glycosyltransferase involved in cell wall biosynthesis
MGIREVEKGVWILSPLVIPFKHHSLFVRVFNREFLRFSIRRFMRKNSFVDPVVWTYHPFMLDAIDKLATGPIVYHCVDDMSAVPGIDSEGFKMEEERLLRKAKVVFTTSTTLMEMCSKFNDHVYNFPNVVDIDFFGKALENAPIPVDLASIPKPRIGYVGALSDYKVDFPLLLDVAEQRPDWHFVLIGEEAEGQDNSIVRQLRQMPNVHLLGHRSYQTLPDYLRGFDVGLLPTLINDYTRAMFPMKYFEYLAAGVPVVSTPLDFTRENKAGLVVAEGLEVFIQAIEQQLERGRFSKEESSSFVADNTWDARMKKMLGIVERSE